MLRDAGVPEAELEAALVAVATYTWGRLLLDSLGQEALSPESRRSSRRPDALEPSAPSFEASFEFCSRGSATEGGASPRFLFWREATAASPKRVVVWSTGGIGAIAIRAVHRRPELVGVWVHSPDKVGRDAGVLAGIERIGVGR